MSYSIKNGKLVRSGQDDWRPLFDGSPVRFIISRPGNRPQSKQEAAA